MKHAVANKSELLSLLEKNGQTIRGYGITKLGLFGSFVRDKDIHAESDVDFIIEFRKGERTYRNKADLFYYLEGLLGRKVELIPTDSLSPYSGPHILKEVENVSLGPGKTSAHARSNRKDFVDHGW
jgi:predicted nucleotidyltransferase